jgi:hypothetical protein
METATVNAKFLGMQMPKNNAHLPFIVATACIALSLLVGGIVAHFTNQPDTVNAIVMCVVFGIFRMLGSVPATWLLVAKLQSKTALVGPNGELVLDAADKPVYYWRFGELGVNRTIYYEEMHDYTASIDIALGFPTGHTVVLKLETNLWAFGNIQSFLTFAKATGYKGDNGVMDFGGGIERVSLMCDIASRVEDALGTAFNSHRDQILQLFGTPEGIRTEDGKQEQAVNDLLFPHIEPIIKEFGLRNTPISFSFKTS